MLIIFTVTNQVTGQVYVGSTRNDLESQWEKMVAAAENNMDYPLYREIRTQGAEHFTVEVWDCTDDRQELALLEEEALTTLNARSLKGYKTSTVKIQPKKKVRQRKSPIEKELASLFAGLSDEPDEPDESDEEIITTDQDKRPQAGKAALPPSQAEADQPVKSSGLPQAAPTQLAAAHNLAAESAPQKALAQEPSVGGSLAKAIVPISPIDLSDGLNAQLAAIQAAADAAIAGDTQTAAALHFIREEAQPERLSIAAGDELESSENMPVQDSREQRIRDAIVRHRKARASKTADMIARERQQLARLLAELEDRACQVHKVSLAAAA